MATNYKYYPQATKIQAATLTATVGTSSTLARLQNTRVKSRMDVDTLGTYVSGADEFMFKIDVGAATTQKCNFIALVKNNLYTQTAKLRVYTDTNDNAGLVDPEFLLNEEDAVSTDEGVWLEEADNERTKRYFWVLLDSIAATAYAGCLLMGEKINPSVDAQLELPVTIDIESGRVINSSPNGAEFIVRTADVSRGWFIEYQLISTADKDLLEDGLFAQALADNPFVFTNNGGTDYYYVRLVGAPVIKVMQADLWNVTFTLQEVVG